MDLGNNILSIVYKERIEKLCEKLYEYCKIKHFVCYIVFNNQKTFVLSNMFHMLLPYYFEKYYLDDFSFREEVIINKDYYLCDRTVSVSKKLSDLLEEKFNLFRMYYIVRGCPECQFVFGAIDDKKHHDYEMLYKKSIQNFENFCIEFVTSMSDIIKQENPNYGRSIVLNDKTYLKKVIKGNLATNETLTSREIECLFWSANGKSSEEISCILSLSKTTIDFYRNEVKRKLNASNIAQAVFEGVKYGYIGAFNFNTPVQRLTEINNFSIR